MRTTTYSPPRLIRYGKVASLSKSDIKCSPGQDFSYKTRWTHPTEQPFTQWTSPTGEQATAGQLIRSGHCQWVTEL